MSASIAWFADIGLEDRPAVGGKGGSLGELTRAGIAVPPGFVVRTEAFEQFVLSVDVRNLVQAVDPAELEQAEAICAAARERLDGADLPPEVEAEIRAALAALAPNDEPVAVRSSATTEDSEDASFAGLQDTYLWQIGPDQVLHAVKDCWKSLYSLESVTYRRRHGLPEAGVAMGVVIQRMVDARCAGVMFTRSPTSGDRSVITIEGAWGLGSAVVSGEVTPDRWVVGKLTGEIPVRDISDKHIRQIPLPGGGIHDEAVPDDLRRTPCLSDGELQELRAIGRACEKHYGKPQDIEWAVERETGAIVLLQSRPETVWAAKEVAPAATAQANPLSHLMSVFGGKR